jgi:hypothetical protein
LKQYLELFHPVTERIPSRIEKQNQIESRFKRVPDEPVRFPAQTPCPVPFNGVTEFARKGKDYPVMGQFIPYHKQLCEGAGYNPSPLESPPYILSFL